MALPHGASDAAIHDMFPADAAARCAAEAAINDIVTRDAIWKRARALLRALAGKEGMTPDVEAPAPAPLRQPADIEEHLAQSAGALHPRGDGAGATEAPASLCEAIAKIGRWREATPSKRAERMARLRALSASLTPLTDRLYDDFAPPHIHEGSPGRPRLHAAWLACIASAFFLDSRILVDCILGFVTVGASPPSGAFPKADPPIFGTLYVCRPRRGLRPQPMAR
eukprot:scaffold7312_cov116-Isochrysis_galbana.AAC.3